MSLGEQRVAKILQKAGLPYQTEVSFKGLKYGKTLLRFDFCVNGVLIEFDGEQHFHHVDFFGDYSTFKHMQENDRRKNRYCLINGIALYRIPFYDLETLNELSDLFRPQYLVQSIYHNDILRKSRELY